MLAARHLLTMVVSLGGMLALTKLIGPAAFGLYAGALGVMACVQGVTSLGFRNYLVRQPALGPDAYHLAFTYLLATGCLGAAGLAAASPWLAGWLALPGFGPVIGGLALGLPLMLLNQVPMAKLERALDFQAVAVIESVAITVHYAVALALAAAGLGAWAPVIGWLAHLLVIGALACRRAVYRPAWRFRSPELAPMLRYGLAVSSPNWFWQARLLAPTLLVGRFLGADTMGALALAIRLVEAAGFLRPIATRLALSAFPRIQHDSETLRRAVMQGLQLQTLALGVALVALTAIAPWLLPPVFGASWLPAIWVMPFVAFGFMAHGLSRMAASALNTLGQTRAVALSDGLHVALFFAVGFWLVPTHGLLGYGIAELIAVGAYALSFHALRQVLGPVTRPVTVACWLAFSMALFTPLWGPWALIGLAIVTGWPGHPHQIRAFLATQWQSGRTHLADPDTRPT